MRPERAPGILVVLLILLVPTSGCYRWSVPRPAPAAHVSDREPAEVHVHLADGTVTALLWPRVEADSLIGTALYGRHGSRREAVALGEIREIRVRRLEPVGTLLTAAGTPLATIAIFRAMYRW